MTRTGKWLIGISLTIWVIFLILGGFYYFITKSTSYDYGVRAQLTKLSFALRRYTKEHGCLPPHAVYSQDGTPLLSWRVILLPSMGKDALFKRFKLDEPWDSPHNSQLLKEIPSHYRVDRGVGETFPYSTRFLVVVGPGAAFEGKVGKKLSEFPKKGSGLLALVESPKAVPWTKPEDLNFEPGQPLPPMGSPESQGVAFITGEGGGVFLRRGECSGPFLQDWILGRAKWPPR